MSPQEISRIVSENQALKEQVRTLQSELSEYRRQMEWFRRQIFGQKSERFESNDSQLTLPLGTVAADAQQQQQTITYTRRSPSSATPHAREEIPAHLPRRIQVLQPAGYDPAAMEKIGEKVTEQMEYRKPEYYVIRIVRPVYAVTINDERRIVCADLPPTCLDKGKAGASLIAHTIVSKVEDHDPLYRQCMQIKRDAGMDVAESTIENWFNAGAFWLEAIADRLRQLLPAAGYQQMDESPIKVMVKPTNGKSTLGYMWLRHSPPSRIVTFDFDLSRSREVMLRLLGTDFKGIIQTDGYCVYEPLGKMPGVIHAGCHGHARRGFERALSNDRKRATFVLDLYRQLFAVEEEAEDAGATAEQRLALRATKSAPLINRFHEWLTAEVKEVKPKSGIGKAILYALGRWDELSRFLADGRIELSNNLIENRVRPFALGRRNWLFAGSEEGAKRLAAAYTVLGTCKLHDLNSQRYLTAVLRELPLRQANDIDDLLPMNWKDPDEPTA